MTLADWAIAFGVVIFGAFGVGLALWFIDPTGTAEAQHKGETR